MGGGLWGVFGGGGSLGVGEPPPNSVGGGGGLDVLSSGACWDSSDYWATPNSLSLFDTHRHARTHKTCTRKDNGTPGHKHTHVCKCARAHSFPSPTHTRANTQTHTSAMQHPTSQISRSEKKKKQTQRKPQPYKNRIG